MRIGVLLPVDFEHPGELLADAGAFDAARADSIWIRGGPDAVVVMAAVAVAARQARLVIDASEPLPPGQLETLRRLSRDRLVVAGSMTDEVWVEEEPPENRAAWAQTVAEHESAGATGLLVPVNPRLLDILRNPEPHEGRPDLQLAQG